LDRQAHLSNNQFDDGADQGTKRGYPNVMGSDAGSVFADADIPRIMALMLVGNDNEQASDNEANTEPHKETDGHGIIPFRGSFGKFRELAEYVLRYALHHSDEAFPGAGPSSRHRERDLIWLAG
jgi:hypothetical protein